jgi:chromosome segregation ATPase
MIKKIFLKSSIFVSLTALFFACGIVDSEAAQGVVDIRSEILKIQNEELDPLVSQIADLDVQINPIEQEIEALELQIEEIYKQGEQLGRDFEDEMRNKYEDMYLEGDEARQKYEEQMEDQWKDIDREQKEAWDNFEDEMEDERDALEDEMESYWDDFEDQMQVKDKEQQQAMKDWEKNSPLFAEREAIKKAWQELDEIRFDIQMKSMEIQEKRMTLQETIEPLRDQQHEIQKSEQRIWDEDITDNRDLINQKHKEIDALYDTLQNAWNSFDQSQNQSTNAPAKNWDTYDAEIDVVWAAFHAATAAIDVQRAAGYAAETASISATNIKEDIIKLEEQHRNDIAQYESLLIEQNQLIAELSGTQTNDGSIKSSLIATIEQFNSEIQSLKEKESIARDGIAEKETQLSIEPATITQTDGTVIPNDVYDQLLGAIDTINVTIDEYQTELNRAQGLLDTANSELNDLDELSSVSSPELTAAYSMSNEYKTIMEDLKKTYAEELATLIANDTSPGDVSIQEVSDTESLEVNLDALKEKAVSDRETALAAVDESFYGTSNTLNVEAPADAAGLEIKITELEAEIDMLSDAQHNAHKNREQQAKLFRVQQREIQNQIDPLDDQQKQLERESRPLQKQQMALQKESMLLEQQSRAIDDKAGDSQEERQKFEESERDKMDDWRRSRQNEIEDLMDDLHDEWEDGSKAKRKSLEREFDDRRDLLESNRKDSEKSFNIDRKSARKEMEYSRDELFAERMAPLEETAKELELQIGVKWTSLDELYLEQENLTKQLESLQTRVKQLDRQAEFGLLEVINGAIQNVEQLESGVGRTGGANFSSFLEIPGTSE